MEVTFEVPAGNCLISGSIDLLLKQDPDGKVLEAEIVDFKAIEGGDEPAASDQIDWTDLSLQVQLYAAAARQVLGENANTGHVHLLKDNKRVQVPVDKEAVDAALGNVRWAVDRILRADYPMRPHPAKCSVCDFEKLCGRRPQQFQEGAGVPPRIFVPGGRQSAKAFGLFVGEE